MICCENVNKIFFIFLLFFPTISQHRLESCSDLSDAAVANVMILVIQLKMNITTTEKIEFQI